MVPAAVLTNGGSATVIITSALLDALIAPPLFCTITGRLPKYLLHILAIRTVLIVPFIDLLTASG
jgi:hypothetical protein